MVPKQLRLRQEKGLPKHWLTFLIALGTATLIFLPFIIAGKGIFIYYGDFNVQQIPFYKLAHEAVRSGDVFWNWYTDLGASFFGSYTFYLLFSPFFWLTLPFPTAAIPYLMAPLLILKTACASMTAFLLIRRFVKNESYAVIGGLLYAFSGWMSFNVFFNHFHEVAVFFPLLILAVEKLVTEDNIGFFALMVALNAIVNYWFFIGEVVFVIIYVIVRSSSRSWKMTGKRFFHLSVEAVLGAGLAMLVLLPSAMALMGNPRAGTDRLLNGWGFWIYWHNGTDNGSYSQRIFAIIQSLFFPPELPAYPNFFPDHGAKWSSLSAWLPMFGMVGVFAYFNQKKTKKDWIRKLLGLCLFFALIPGFNSLFVLLNTSYYARWFYMPILFMAIATVKAIENSRREQKSFKEAIKWVLIITTIFAVACGATPTRKNGSWELGIARYPSRVWIWYGIVVVGTLLVALLVIHFRKHPEFQRYLCAALVVVIVGFNTAFIAMGRSDQDKVNRILETAIKGRYEISLPDDEFARSDIYDTVTQMDNMLMYWHLPNIQAFHSVVPNSIMEFYPEVGVKRDVGSRPEVDFYALRSLLSVKWLFIKQEQADQEPMPGFLFYDEQLDYNVYENENFIPMGFAYDEYIDEHGLDGVVKENRPHMFVQAVYLEDDAIARNSDILTLAPRVRGAEFNEMTLSENAYNRNKYTVTEFAIDTRGFSAKSDFDKDKLIFFSVPYEAGWSATVNGEEAIVEKANIGFMAIRVPAGETEIRFNYMTPGLKIGGAITVISAIAILALFLLTKQKRKEQKELIAQKEKSLQESRLPYNWDEYLYRYDKLEAITEELEIAEEEIEEAEESADENNSQ